jgi:hydroxymethylpyrimidine pyrophosphatase-like HAD family hydrolase
MIYFTNFYNNDYEFKLSSKITLDINVTGVSNYEGIKTIMMLYKIKSQNVFVFGNSSCDIELMKNIKNTYSTKESMPVIQELSNHIVEFNETHTLALEIEKILKK